MGFKEAQEKLKSDPASSLLLHDLFIGRKEELRAMHAALERSKSGRPQFCMVEGDAGIGKTRLFREFASIAETEGATVLWGRCHEDADVPPFWPWIDIIREYIEKRSSQEVERVFGAGAADVAQIVPELHGKLPGLVSSESLSAKENRFRLFDSTLEF